MKTVFLVVFLVFMVATLALTLYKVIWSPRHRKFRVLCKEFEQVNAAFKASAPNSPEASASLERMKQIIDEQKQLIRG